jgi:hypothetical protein
MSRGAHGADEKKSPLGRTISSFSEMAEKVAPVLDGIIGARVEFVGAQVMLWPRGAEDQAYLHSCGSPTLSLNDWRGDWQAAVPFAAVRLGKKYPIESVFPSELTTSIFTPS